MNKGFNVAILCSTLAIVLHIVTTIVLSCLAPWFNYSEYAISALGSQGAQHALLMNVFGFVVPGLLFAGSFASLYRMSNGVTLSRLGAASCMTGCISFAMLGVWPFPHRGHIYALVATMLFCGIGMVVLGWSARKESKPYFVFSVMAAVLLLGQPVWIFPKLRHLGYVQRASAMAALMWVMWTMLKTTRTRKD